jgi:hypothetical protein
LLAFAAAIAAGLLGFHAGEAFAYGIAALMDRDIAELKDMLIWASVGGAPVGAAAGVWLALTLLRASADGRRIALVLLGVIAGGYATLLLLSYDWPKSSGKPVVQYELRLPAGTRQPTMQTVALTIWRDRNGQGCYIASIRRVDDRPEIAGSFVMGNGEKMLSLQLSRAAEGYWQLPIRDDAPLDKAFGPWQRIEFVPPPRGDVRPPPPGDYEIRYRVRRYM